MPRERGSRPCLSDYDQHELKPPMFSRLTIGVDELQTILVMFKVVIDALWMFFCVLCRHHVVLLTCRHRPRGSSGSVLSSGPRTYSFGMPVVGLVYASVSYLGNDKVECSKGR